MNKVTPRIRQYRVKAPVSTRHSQQLSQELEFLFSPNVQDQKPIQLNRAKLTRRKGEILPSLKDRISRVSSIM